MIEIDWEYGATFSEDGKDAGGFPTFWTTNIKEAKEDMDWYVQKQATAFPNRKWRIIKRYPSTRLELNDEEKEQLNG